MGTLPPVLGAWDGLEILDCGRNLLEGTVPESVASLTKLWFMGMAGKGHGPCLRGTLPRRLGLLVEHKSLLFQKHSLEGLVPAFMSTLQASLRRV